MLLRVLTDCGAYQYDSVDLIEAALHVESFLHDILHALEDTHGVYLIQHLYRSLMGNRPSLKEVYREIRRTYVYMYIIYTLRQRILF